MPKNIYFLIIFLILTACANAQVIEIKANNPSIRYDLIKPGQHFQRVTSFDSTGKATSEFINEDLIKVDTAVHTISFIRSRQIPFGQYYIDTSVINAAGPVYYHENSNPAGYEVKANFGQTQVKAIGIKKGKSTPKVTAMSPGYFDDNIMEDIIGYVAIEKNVKYRLNCYRYESKGEVNTFEVEYVFDDFIASPYGEMAGCKVLHFTHGFGSGYLWIDKLTHLTLKEVITHKNTSSLVVEL